MLDASQEAVFFEEEAEGKGFSIHPNPASGNITITFPFSGPETIQQKFYSIDGKSTRIRTLTLDEGNDQIDISLQDLPPALYTIELFSSKGVFRQTILRK